MARKPRKQRTSRRNPQPPVYRKAAKASDQAKKDMKGMVYPWSVGGKLIVYPINPRAALYARDVFTLGEHQADELAAVKGVEFGVLSKFPKKDVIAFGNKVSQARGGNFPLPSKIVNKDANIVTLLVASGDSEDLTAESIFPLGDNGWFGNLSIASILLNSLLFGLWSDGEWKGEVYFVIPKSQERGEVDAIEGEKLISYLCGKRNDKCPSSGFLSDLEKAADFLGRNLPQKFYKFLGITERDDRERRDLFILLKSTLSTMPIGYQGTKTKLRTVKADDYYGSGPRERALTTDRKKVRMAYTLGDEAIGVRDRLAREGSMVLDEPDSFADLMARQTDQEQKDFLARYQEKMAYGVDLDGKDSAKLEKEAYRRAASATKMKAHTTKIKKGVRQQLKVVKKGLPLKANGPLISFMFTLYWEDPDSEDGIYKIVSHSKSYKVGELEVLIAAVLRNPPAHVPLDGKEDKKNAREVNPYSRRYTLASFTKKYFPVGWEHTPAIAKEFWDDFRWEYQDGLSRYIKETTYCSLWGEDPPCPTVRGPERGWRAKKEDIPMVLAEVAALRCVVLRDMGIRGLNHEIKKGTLPPHLLVAATVDYPRAKSWTKLGLPTPVKVTESIGMYFGELYLQTGRDGKILVSEFTSPWVEEGKPNRLIPRTIAQSAAAVISKSLLGVETTAQGLLRPTESNLFSLAKVKKTGTYSHWSKAIAEKAKTPLDPEVLAAKAYKKTMSSSMSGQFGAKGTPDEITAGRRSAAAFGGTKITKSRRERGQKQHVTQQLSVPQKSIFSFAMELCKTKGVMCAHSFKAGDRFNEGDIAEWMEAYNVEGDEGDKGALRELKGKLEALLGGNFYTHKLAGILQPGSDDDLASTPMLDALALDNTGRRARRRRKPRSPRRNTRGRRNPLDDINTDRLVSYGIGQGDKKVRGERKVLLESALRKIRPAPEDWEISSASVDAFFPRTGSKATLWAPSQRLQEARNYDLIARLEDPRLTAEERTKIINEAEDSAMPFMSEGSGKAFQEGAELSLAEAMGILSKQQTKRKSSATMQPSSALCMNERTRKLAHYTLPGMDDPHKQAGLWRGKVIDSRLNPNQKTSLNPNRDVILWVSPKGAAPRVMTFRRGSHLDCDFTSDDLAELPELLGKAIQSSMYWLRERPSRNRGRQTSIWVGRAGEKGVYLAWNSVQDEGASHKFSVKSILSNLRNPDRRAVVLEDREARDDKKYYQDSVAALFGGRTSGSFKPRATKAPSSPPEGGLTPFLLQGGEVGPVIIEETSGPQNQGTSQDDFDAADLDS